MRWRGVYLCKVFSFISSSSTLLGKRLLQKFQGKKTHFLSCFSCFLGHLKTSKTLFLVLKNQKPLFFMVLGAPGLAVLAALALFSQPQIWLQPFQGRDLDTPQRKSQGTLLFSHFFGTLKISKKRCLAGFAFFFKA